MRQRAAVHLPIIVATVSLLCMFSSTKLGSEEGPETSEIPSHQPKLYSVFPMACQPGGRVLLEVRGEFLDGVSKVLFETQDISGNLHSSSFTTARIEVSVSSIADPGLRRFRLVSRRGASNLVLFWVSRWPTVSEVEPNDELDSPTIVGTPVLISGRLLPMDDVDLYRFHASRGMRLQFNVLGMRSGAHADVSLAILHLDGREISHEEGRFIWDPYLEQSFDKEGDYLAAITLTRMPAGGQTRTDVNYQLAIGQSPMLWSLFPMGAARGSSTELLLWADFIQPLTLLGGGKGYEKSGRTDSLDPYVEKIQDVSFTLRDPSSEGFLKFVATILAEAIPGVRNFKTKDDSGIEVPLQFVIGNLPEISELEPNDGPSKAASISLPVTINGRIERDGDEDWYRFSVENRQSLTFMIDAEKYGSVFDSYLTLLDMRGKILASSDDAKWLGRPLNRDSEIEYTFEETGDYLIKVSDLYRRGGPDHVYRLTVRRPEPDFRLSLNNDHWTVMRGGKGKIGVGLQRQGGFAGDVSIQISGLDQGMKAKRLVFSADQETGELELEANSEASLTLSEIEVFGVGKVDGKEVRRRAILLSGKEQGSGPGFSDPEPIHAFLAVVAPPLFALEPAASTVYLVKGGVAEFGVKVTRRQDFVAPLSLTLENLPEGVSLEKFEMIDEGRLARVRLKASSSAKAVNERDLTIIGTAEAGGERIVESAPRISLQVD